MYAVNIAGMSAPSAASAPFTCVFVPPPAIAAVTLTAGLGKLSFSFKAPLTNANTPILTYMYIINDNVSDYTHFIDAHTTSTSFVIMGLPNNVYYTARVIAVNAAGPSPPSPAMKTPVIFYYDVPSAPAITAVTASNETVVVAFTAPTKFNNSPLIKYQYSLDGSPLVDASGLVSPLTITGIPNNVSHTIQLAAVNSLGASALSNTSKPFVYMYGPPPPPVLGTLTVAGGKATLVVSNASANPAVTDYAYSLNGSSSYTPAGTKTPIAISGLTRGQTYTISVVATNILGTSSPSTTPSFVSK
jgi:hypothetical protein